MLQVDMAGCNGCNPLEAGTIIQRLADGRSASVAYEMRMLKRSSLPQMLALQTIILQRLSRKDMLQPFGSEFMGCHLTEQGFAIGIFACGALIAFRCVYFPSVDDEQWNLGFDIGLPQAERDRVANLQMVCVNPAFRGNAFHLQCLRFQRWRWHAQSW